MDGAIEGATREHFVLPRYADAARLFDGWEETMLYACLDRGLYPSWDAYDARSVSLAARFGYRSAGAYPVSLLWAEK